MNSLADYWPVVVIGAGPAGCLAAREIARCGVRVLLVERDSFPRHKVCGCCLNFRGREALRKAGLNDLLENADAQELRSLQWSIGSRSVTLPLRGGVSISRERMDWDLMKAAIDVGVILQDRCSAEPGEEFPNHRLVHLQNLQGKRQISAGLVLVCDGLSSRSGKPVIQENSRIGLGTILPSSLKYAEPNKLWMNVSKSGYLGIVHLEDGRLALAAAADRSAIREFGSPGQFAMELLRSARQPIPESLEYAQWQGTSPLTRKNQIAEGRLFRLGDAAGYIEPFTGEGMAWALTAACAVVPLAITPWLPEHRVAWKRIYREKIADSQRKCRLAAKLLRSPVCVSGLVGISKIVPGIAARIVRQLHPVGSN